MIMIVRQKRGAQPGVSRELLIQVARQGRTVPDRGGDTEKDLLPRNVIFPPPQTQLDPRRSPHDPRGNRTTC